MDTVEIKLIRLPQNLKNEVEDFRELLLEKSARKPTLNWMRGLREFTGQYTALELRKKANQWIPIIFEEVVFHDVLR